MKTDIAIVGAGPAGSTAAEVAATAGLDVVLIDRKTEIGTPVQCGGFLPEAGELRELMPRARLPTNLIELPERCVLHRTRLQRLYSPSGKCKEFQVAGRTVDRRAFDRHIAAQAARAGARVLPGTIASFPQPNLRLSGRFPGDLQAKVIIGADGPYSSIGRAIDGHIAEMGICLEYEMVNVDIDPNSVEMYFGMRYAPGGYAWIIPMGLDMANVGIGIRASYMRGLQLPKLLDKFIEGHPVARDRLNRGRILAIIRGSVPASGMPGSIQKGSVLLAGDAAGHVMATSGGGIPLAMVAGKIAGEVASGSITGQLKLDDYAQIINAEFGKELERSVQIRRMVDVVMRSDRLMDALLGALEPDQIKSIIRGQMPSAFSAIYNMLVDRSHL